MQYLALVDTDCLRTIVDADRCWSWTRAAVDVTTIGGMSHLCCSVGMVTVATEGGNSVKISVLVVRGKPLGYDLVLGIDAIRMLGGISVWPSGEIRISGGQIPKCAAITINKPDFTVTFDQESQAWIAAWKWSEDRAPEGMEYRSIQWQQRFGRITSRSFAYG